MSPPIIGFESPIIGFDSSLSHSAAHWEAGGIFGGTFAIKSEPKRFAHRLARLQEIRGQLLAHLHAVAREHGLGLVFVEGYAYGARNDRETLGEWGGLLRVAMLDLGWDVVEVAPPTLKKYVTGKGNAEKDGIRMEVLKRWQYESTDNNDADAYALMRLGFDWLRWKNGEHVTKALSELCAKLVVLRADAKVEAPPPKKSRKKAPSPAAPVDVQPAA